MDSLNSIFNSLVSTLVFSVPLQTLRIFVLVVYESSEIENP